MKMQLPINAGCPVQYCMNMRDFQESDAYLLRRTCIRLLLAYHIYLTP